MFGNMHQSCQEKTYSNSSYKEVFLIYILGQSESSHIVFAWWLCMSAKISEILGYVSVQPEQTRKGLLCN